MASGHAFPWGINWPVAVCIDYHVSVGLDQRDFPVKNRRSTDQHHIDRRQ